MNRLQFHFRSMKTGKLPSKLNFHPITKIRMPELFLQQPSMVPVVSRFMVWFQLVPDGKEKG
ncbi:MAG: hypothetical protein ACKOPP_03800, partial [Bacteroidota bacterium]